jgi:hypothetical protein
VGVAALTIGLGGWLDAGAAAPVPQVAQPASTVTVTVPPVPEKRHLTADPTTPPAFYETCEAARSAGAAPLTRGDPGYREELDEDGDGTACE